MAISPEPVCHPPILTTPFLSSLSLRDLTTFLEIIEDSLQVRRHIDLFQWLQDEVQVFLPHDILIAAWGDFFNGDIQLDVVSYLPGLRTTDVDRKELLPLLMQLFDQWSASERAPFLVSTSHGDFHFGEGSQESDLGAALAQMHSALVQGIKDERSRIDCLYVALSANGGGDAQALGAMQMLLPYIDAALRQVAHLPGQYPPLPELWQEHEALMSEAPLPVGEEMFGLSSRELEIMRWVRGGKTNQEIGTILDISAFTVKNHLQRIFRKLDVLNRAQAVAKLERVGLVRG
jgi:transcriptional regulator EpsA